jgi:hypothetical protein
LAEDPSFFCEVIQTVFRSSKDEVKVEVTDELKSRARKAYHLLREWRIPPGTQRDGTFNSNGLNSWVETVKDKLTASGHWEVAAGQIGEVLFYAPRDDKGLWVESVCAVLDQDDNARLRRGLTMKIFNARGVFTPDGGKSELAFAKEWSLKASLAEEKGFSLLGQELIRLADSYRRDAEREAKSDPFAYN